MLVTRSASRAEYPLSLSYQPTTFTISPTIEVNCASTIQECGLPSISTETIGSSVYSSIPFRLVSEATLKAALISSTVVSFSSRHDTTRSEEHTSELQSLMRISYAVFCLKKKNKPTTKIRITITTDIRIKTL